MDKNFLLELEKIVGEDGIRLTEAQKQVYGCDAYTIEKSLPGVVVLPRTTHEVARIAMLCHLARIPMVPRGSGTGLAGGSMAHPNEVLVCVSRMNQILEVDTENRQIRAQAGVLNINLTRAVQKDGFHFAPDPSSQSASTIGGNIANNSGGPHTLKHGVTVNHIVSMQMVLGDGEIVEISHDDHGYDLLGIAVGSEGTFGIVTEATVKLVPNPEAIRTLLAVCDSVDTATKLVGQIIASGIVPAALEMMDKTILTTIEATYHLGFPPDAGAILLIEIDGYEAGIDRQAEQIAQICETGGALSVKIGKDPVERAKLWTARKKGIGTIGRLAPSCATQDGVAPRSKLPEMLRQIEAIGKKYNLRIANIFHAGDGNLHPAVLFDERNPEEVKRVLAAGGEILKACVDAGGALTGEHGIGIEKQEFLSLIFSENDLETMARIRNVFNPDGLVNPGKLLPIGGNCCPHLPRPDTAELQSLIGRNAGSV
jgi:glycolate oxidase